MGMFNINGVEYLTGNDLQKELGLGKSTVYSRFRYKSAPERWGVEVVTDPTDKIEKYVVSRENFEKIWKKQSILINKRELERKRFIKSKTPKK